MGNLVGQQIEHYQVIALLGEGRLGSVYEARDLNLARNVALKVVRAEYARQPAFQTAFLQAAQTTARLDHPGIIHVYEVRNRDDLLYLVMEHMGGGNLQGELRRLRYKAGQMDVNAVLRLGTTLASALSEAHQVGLVHGGITPANILLKNAASTSGSSAPGQAVLTDFGLALLYDDGLAPDPAGSDAPYLAPELLAGDRADARSDLYALGAVLYEMLTNRPPEATDGGAEIGPDRALHRPDLPAGVGAVVMQAMAGAPEARYPSAAALAEALQRLGGPQPVSITGLAAAGTAAALATSTNGQTRIESVDELAVRNAAMVLPALTDRDQLMVSESVPRNYLLDQELVTIGRSEENDIVLRHENVSLRHATLTRTPDGGWQIMDLGSQNGVYIDGTPLLPQVAEEWYPNQVLRIGPYYFQLRSAAQMPVISTAQSEVSLILTPSRPQTAPGGQAQVQIVLVNGGKERRYIQVAVLDLAPDWYTIAQDAVRLMPGERGELALTLHPPAGAATLAGEYRFQVVAKTISGPPEQVAVSGVLAVTSVGGYEVELQPRYFKDRGIGEIRITNRGNSDAIFAITGHSPQGLVEFEAEEAEVVYGERGAQAERPSGLATAAAALQRGRQQANIFLRSLMQIPFLRRLPFVADVYSTQHQADYYARLGRQVSGTQRQRPSGPARPQVKQVGPSVRTTGRIQSSTDLHTHVQVPAGQTETVAVGIRPHRRPALGRGERYTFELRVGPFDEARGETLEAALSISPAIPFWFSTGVTVVFLLLCLGGLAFAAARLYQPLGRDSDRDGLANSAETERYFTDPELADTDGDGVPDGDEVAASLNPNNPDTDGDGLSDGAEQELGTDPLLVDTDRDGIPDGIEANELESSPLRRDSDGDGVTDLDELMLASGPNAWARLLPPTPTPGVTATPTPTPAPTATPGVREATFYSLASQDGSVAEDGDTNRGGELSVVGESFAVGQSGRQQLKGFVSFDTSAIPPGAEIERVTLRLTRERVDGEPYARLGDLHADLAPAGGFSGSPALEAQDFEAPDAATNVILLTRTLGAGDVAEGELAPRHFGALNRSGVTQFRIYFTLTTDQGAEDALLWLNGGESGDSLARPQLIVVYRAAAGE